MNKAIFLTAYNRPQYLKQTLDSWSKVRGFHDWHLYVQIEPNAFADEQVDMIKEIGHPDAEILVNPQVYGVLHNPWVGFERLFQQQGFDFVIRAEDDLVVSADILEFFDFASEKYKNDPQVAAVQGFSFRHGDPSGVVLTDTFSPWVFGTWQDRWEGLLGPTWDHDYSTYNGMPGNESGWDWNINTRLYPQYGLLSVEPIGSRVHNIGYFGTHALPDNYVTSDSFSTDHGVLKHRQVDG